MDSQRCVLRAARALLGAAALAPALGAQSVRATLPDSTFWPEGVDYDARTGRFYVASVRHGTVAEVAPDGRVRELWPRHAPGVSAVFGVRVDTARGVLWVTTSGVPQAAGYRAADSTIAALLRVRIADGAIERRWELPPAPAGHVLGDLAVGPHGDVFFTDSRHPMLYRLRPGGDTLEHFTHPLFRSLQGLAPTPDGRVLYLADYSNSLLRVELGDGAVTVVGNAADARTRRGCDGIAWYEGSIIAVQNGATPARVVRYFLNEGGTDVTRTTLLAANAAIADEPTIGTIAGSSFVYVANSQWEKYDEQGVRKRAIALTPPVLLSVPLARGDRAP